MIENLPGRRVGVVTNGLLSCGARFPPRDVDFGAEASPRGWELLRERLFLRLPKKLLRLPLLIFDDVLREIL